MLQLQLKRPSLDVEDQYSGKGVQFSPLQAVSTVRAAFSKTITTKLMKQSGPVYYGELEKLVLDPMVDVSVHFLALPPEDRDYLSVLQSFAARGIAYAIIDQILKVYEIREVAKYLTNDMLKTSPIWQAVQAVNADEAQQAEEQLEEEDKPRNDSVLRVLQAWIAGDTGKQAAGSSWFTTANVFGAAADDTPALLRLISAEMFGGDDKITLKAEEITSSVSEIYKHFVTIAKTGKGMALAPERRSSVMQKVMTVRAAVTGLFDLSESCPEDERLTVLATGMALGTALLNYLTMSESPDSFFPRQELQFNVIAWAGGLKQEAAELKQFWTYHAIAPASFTIELARQLWESETEWMNFLGSEFEVMSQARELLKSQEERFEAVQAPFYRDIARRVLEDVKVQSGATHLLPLNFMHADNFAMAVDDTIAAIRNGDVLWHYDGTNDVTNPTRMFDIPYAHKRQLSDQMAMQAQVIADSYALVLRSAQLVSLTPDDVQPLRPLVDISVSDLLWEPLAPVEAGHTLTFTKPAMVSAAVPKWAGKPWPATQAELDSFVPEWSEQRFMYQPMRPNRALWAQLTAMEPMIMWNKSEVPEVMGDAITRPFGTQPVPACYTFSRNRTIRPHTMREYLLSMQGAIDGIPATDYLRHAAELIAMYGHLDPLAQAVVDYLAPVMAVRTSELSSAYIEPTLKTLYGVPTGQFFAKQLQDEDRQVIPVARDTASVGGFTTQEDLVSYTVHVERSSGPADITVSFLLHRWFPKPQKIVRFVQTLPTGLSVQCPILAVLVEQFFAHDNRAPRGVTGATASGTAWEDAIKNYLGNDLIDAILSLQDNAVVEWMLAGGFAPFKLWMPATYFQVYQRPSQLTQERVLYAAAAAVKWRVDPVTGALQVRGFVKDPICILDNSDRSKALADVDPIPEPLAVVAPEAINTGIAAPGHEEGPQPTSAAPGDPIDSLQDAANTVKVPTFAAVTDPDSGKAMVVSLAGKTTGEQEQLKNTAPLTGDPDAGSELIWVVVNPDDAEKKLKKVKKDKVPAGSRVASEMEIKEWLVTNPEGNES